MRGRPHRFHFYDTASPEKYTSLAPNMLILCFDISNRQSLESLQDRWRREMGEYFNSNEALPVMVLGLKRDLRREWTREERAKLKGATLMPQEGLLVAQEMLCDLYAECSALTGELFGEVVEDIARMAANTLTDSGGRKEERPE